MTITFYIFDNGTNANDEVDFSGSYYSNGGFATNVAAGCGEYYSIAAVMSTYSKDAFFEWISDDGSFNSATSSSTSFTPTTSNGHIDMVLKSAGTWN